MRIFQPRGSSVLPRSVTVVAAIGLFSSVVAAPAQGNRSGEAGHPAGSETAVFLAASEVFQRQCAACHGGPGAPRGLRLEADRIYRSTVNVPASSDRRRKRIVPGDVDASLLYQVLLSAEDRSYDTAVPRMPEAGPPLADDEKAAIRAWIESFPAELWGEPRPVEVTAAPASQRTFHDGHLVNLPTVDALGKRHFQFRIAHRFNQSTRQAGGRDLYGLDGGASISLGLTYGLSPRWEVGLRHTNFQKAEEVFFKVALLPQKKDGSPVSLSYQGGISRVRESGRVNRSRGTAQVVVARRFNRYLSAMVVPMYSTKTNYLDALDTRATFAVGAGGEWRLRPGMAFTAEWIGQLSGVEAAYQSVSVGLSMGSPRHGFHLVLTNTEGMHPDLYAPGGDLDAGDGHFRLGFNISRLYGPP